MGVGVCVCVFVCVCVCVCVFVCVYVSVCLYLCAPWLTCGCRYEFEGTMLNIPVGAVAINVQLHGQQQPTQLQVKWGQVQDALAFACVCDV